MKYILFLAAMSVSLFAQGQQVKLGFRSGVSFSNFYAHHSSGEIPNLSVQSTPGGPIIVDPNSGNHIPSHYYKTNFIKDGKPGFFAYLHAAFKIKQRLSAEAGLGFTQRGIDISYNLSSTSVTTDNNFTKQTYQFKQNLRLDYISVPLTLQYKLDKKERFYVLAGVYNAVALKFLMKESLVSVNQQTFDAHGNALGTSASQSWTTDAYASRFDAGLISGVGVNFPLTEKMSIGIEFRNTLGLVNVPQKYEAHGFHSFSETAKNINFEAGLKLERNFK